MDILNVIQEILPDVEIDSNGVASFTRASICRVLGISKASLSSDMPQKLAERLSGFGFELYGKGERLPDSAVAIIIEYFAFDARKISPVAVQLYRAFASVGIRVYFQEAKGWKLQESNQPPVASLSTSLNELKVAREGLDQLIKIMDYASDKPGLNSVVGTVITDDVAALPGVMPLSQLLADRWAGLSMGQRVYLSRAVADTFKAMYLIAPKVEYLPYKNKNGKLVKRAQAVYPVDFMPMIECCYTQFANRYDLAQIDIL